MALLGGLIGKLLALAVLVVVLLGSILVWAYAADYGVHATVTEKDCSLRIPLITVKTEVLGLQDKAQVSTTQCALIERGNYVVYHLRSQRTIIYESKGGDCLFDSASDFGQRC